MLKTFSKQALVVLLFMSLISCKSTSDKKMNSFKKGTYGYDIEFLKQHTKPVELKNGTARLVLSPEYQGRVMTSSANGENGLSYGWINHDLIASGDVVPQINPVGGEERFWLGPEGGQYSLFFKNGSSFDFENWATPACLDSDTFELINQSDTSAEFSKAVKLVNYSNFHFSFNMIRKVNLLDEGAIKDELNIEYSKQIKALAYKTVNQLKNTGEKNWSKETGLLSVWMLGMFNPSDEVTIFIPYKTDVQSDYIVKDDYFGAIPEDRLVVKNGMVFFKGDGKQRGKIGIPPQRALPVIGSYDAINQVLTVLKCEIPENETNYVNSAWEMQKFPYQGDAINSYNDGPLEDGSQMGPFYELETSSPALQLKAGESATYKQTTLHFEGSENDLNAICQQIFNVTLADVKAVF